VEFEVVWGEHLLGFELGNDVNGGGVEEEEEEQQRERRERQSWGRGQVREKGGSRAIAKLPLPTLFYLFGPSCSGIGGASLIRNPNSKFNG